MGISTLFVSSSSGRMIDKLVRRTGTKGAGEEQLDEPRGICSDYNGDVYVADCV